MKILEFKLKINKIMKIIEFQTRIIKIKNIRELETRNLKIIEIINSMQELLKQYENHSIAMENNKKNNGNHEIQIENQ